MYYEFRALLNATSLQSSNCDIDFVSGMMIVDSGHIGWRLEGFHAKYENESKRRLCDRSAINPTFITSQSGLDVSF